MKVLKLISFISLLFISTVLFILGTVGFWATFELFNQNKHVEVDSFFGKPNGYSVSLKFPQFKLPELSLKKDDVLISSNIPYVPIHTNFVATDSNIQSLIIVNNIHDSKFEIYSKFSDVTKNYPYITEQSYKKSQRNFEKFYKKLRIGNFTYLLSIIFLAFLITLISVSFYRKSLRSYNWLFGLFLICTALCIVLLRLFVVKN